MPSTLEITLWYTSWHFDEYAKYSRDHPYGTLHGILMATGLSYEELHGLLLSVYIQHSSAMRSSSPGYNTNIRGTSEDNEVYHLVITTICRDYSSSIINISWMKYD